MNIQEEFDSLFDKKYERLMEERYGNNPPKSEIKTDKELGKLLNLPANALGKVRHETKNKVKINNVEKYLMDQRFMESYKKNEDLKYEIKKK